MNNPSTLFLLLCLLTVAYSSRKVVITRTSVPSGWKTVGDADPSHILRFFIALPQQNLDQLEQMFWDRTDPTSPNYREWMSIKEINDLVSPPESVQKEVISWLMQSGITDIKNYGDALEVTGTVSSLQHLFQTQFQLFEHEDGRLLVRQYGTLTIPNELADNIVMIAGLSNFPPKRNEKVKKTEIQKRQWGWDTYVVPQTLWNIYSIPQGTQASNTTSQCVVEWEDQYFNPADLAGFATNMAVPNLPPLTADHIIGPNDPANPGTESTLDIEWIAATGINAQNWFWIEGDTTVWLYGFSVHFMNTQNVPLVNSMSYGWNEEDQCEYGIGGNECSQLGVNSTQYVARVNVEFQKIGLRGITLFAASGDSGANGRTDESCTESHFNPAFPAASPYVTAVGATQLDSPVANLQNPPPICKSADYWYCASGGTEQAVSFSSAGFGSGGGFSYVASAPAFQQQAIKNYLNSQAGKRAPASYFNANGRGYPDIAALGSKILIWLGGTNSAVGGTSCSSPIVAGVFTLLNDYAIKKTGKPLGPVTQLIYQMAQNHPAAFTDITVGDNTCTESGCGIPIISPCLGFYCTQGWDPVTGWGTPVYTEMVKYLAQVLN